MSKTQAKHLLIASICMIAAHHPLAYATDDAEKIGDIVKTCAAINDYATYKKIQVEVMGKSAEGGVAVGYFAGGELNKIVEKLYGETGGVTTEYYFDAAKLIFVFSKEEFYKKTIKNPTFGAADRIREQRYYFSGGKLIDERSQWTDNSGYEVADPGQNYAFSDLSAADLLKEVAELRRLILKSK